MGPEQAPPPIVAVHPDGSLPPLVFFHTWFHEADRLQALGQELGDDQPLYAVDHPPPDGPLPEDLAAWVRYHRRGLDRIPVCSPYQLAGFSFGGVVALEIAMQLQAEGATVAWLGLVDTLRPKRNPKGLRPYLRYHCASWSTSPRGRRAKRTCAGWCWAAVAARCCGCATRCCARCALRTYSQPAETRRWPTPAA